MVLAPDEPEVYWGLAEADRHLGNFAQARAYYQKVLDYDPDGPHGKGARKALKEPEIANAKSVAPPAPEPPNPSAFRLISLIPGATHTAAPRSDPGSPPASPESFRSPAP